MHNYSASNGFISDEAMLQIIDANDASLSNQVAAGTTSPLCVVGGAVSAASAYLDDACPTSGCTHSC
ncbi:MULTISPECIES: hypothetical protein [Corynebacterium]|uniref:hypothetical protein n=1 Tax=Corynebacterium TaxID=1716 RepID=UPI00165A0EE5|nr:MULTISPECIES: hypothetical protein [Corynebacterium]QNP92182.1 hypothetical protein IAU67_09325 [Corynebacterium zhongnanshanii]